jgi:hypothetical protein
MTAAAAETSELAMRGQIKLGGFQLRRHR